MNPELREEIDILIFQSESRHDSKGGNIFVQMTQPEVYKPIVIMIGFFAFQQLSGIFVVVVYAASFATSVGVTMDPFLCVVYIGIIRVIAGGTIGLLLDKLGRCKPTIYSAIVMAVCMYGLAAWTMYPIDNFGWIPVVLILLYVFSSTLGLLTIPFVMNAEIFPRKYRGFGSGLTICAAYSICFVCVKLYPMMVTDLGSVHVCLIYGTCSLLSIFYVACVLPETKGKTLSEIENMFKPRHEPTIAIVKTNTIATA